MLHQQRGNVVLAAGELVPFQELFELPRGNVDSTHLMLTSSLSETLDSGEATAVCIVSQPDLIGLQGLFIRGARTSGLCAPSGPCVPCKHFVSLAGFDKKGPAGEKMLISWIQRHSDEYPLVFLQQSRTDMLKDPISENHVYWREMSSVSKLRPLFYEWAERALSQLNGPVLGIHWRRGDYPHRTWLMHRVGAVQSFEMIESMCREWKEATGTGTALLSCNCNETELAWIHANTSCSVSNDLISSTSALDLDPVLSIKELPVLDMALLTRSDFFLGNLFSGLSAFVGVQRNWQNTQWLFSANDTRRLEFSRRLPNLIPRLLNDSMSQPIRSFFLKWTGASNMK